MAPEERAQKALEGVGGDFDHSGLISRIADQIREAVWEERNACIRVAAEFSDQKVRQDMHEELRRSGMDPAEFSVAAWVGLMICRRPNP